MFDSSRFCGFPENKYDALDEVERFLESNGVNLGQAFEVLLSSHDGYLIYWFGSIEIQFTRGFGVWSGNSNAIQMSLELDDEENGRTKVYEYCLRDLRLVKRKRS